jgi:hypothetical protein
MAPTHSRGLHLVREGVARRFLLGNPESAGHGLSQIDKGEEDSVFGTFTFSKPHSVNRFCSADRLFPIASIRSVAGSVRDSLSPFVAYHRARRVSALVRVIAIGVPVAVVVAGLCMLGSAGTAQAGAVSADTLAAINSGLAVLPTPTPTPTISTYAVPHSSSSAAPAVASGPSVVHIVVTATGYQHELDECQWVRMDLAAEAPIVGAHTRCGGVVVLTMRPGQIVELSGQSLDGRYVVTDSRDAHAGDDAATATAGMRASVILQTCYPGSGGHERLIGLEPED